MDVINILPLTQLHNQGKCFSMLQLEDGPTYCQIYIFLVVTNTAAICCEVSLNFPVVSHLQMLKCTWTWNSGHWHESLVALNSTIITSTPNMKVACSTFTAYILS